MCKVSCEQNRSTASDFFSMPAMAHYYERIFRPARMSFLISSFILIYQRVIGLLQRTSRQPSSTGRDGIGHHGQMRQQAGKEQCGPSGDIQGHRYEQNDKRSRSTAKREGKTVSHESLE